MPFFVDFNLWSAVQRVLQSSKGQAHKAAGMWLEGTKCLLSARVSEGLDTSEEQEGTSWGELEAPCLGSHVCGGQKCITSFKT